MCRAADGAVALCNGGTASRRDTCVLANGTLVEFFNCDASREATSQVACALYACPESGPAAWQIEDFAQCAAPSADSFCEFVPSSGHVLGERNRSASCEKVRRRRGSARVVVLVTGQRAPSVIVCGSDVVTLVVADAVDVVSLSLSCRCLILSCRVVLQPVTRDSVNTTCVGSPGSVDACELDDVCPGANETVRRCANDCSLRGTCGSNGVCQCNDGFFGGWSVCAFSRRLSCVDGVCCQGRVT
jgi:hypothetical protein